MNNTFEEDDSNDVKFTKVFFALSLMRLSSEFARVLAKSSTPPHSCNSIIPSRTQQIVPNARNAFTRTFL